jgi:hypothetical protein
MAEVPKTQEHLFGGSPEKQVPTLLPCTELLKNYRIFQQLRASNKHFPEINE